MSTAAIFCIIMGFLGFTGIVCGTAIALKKISKKCKHEWKTVKEINLTHNGVQIGYRYIQQCTHCGAVQNVDCY